VSFKDGAIRRLHVSPKEREQDVITEVQPP